MNLLRDSLCRMALCALTASPAWAGDYYVDAANGSNSNGGTSTADAWATITHALGQVPTPPAGQSHAIHVAAGTYDQALGESFPLLMRPGLQLIGTGPTTRIDGGSQASQLIRVETGPGGVQAEFGPDTLLRDLTLEGAVLGVYIRAENFDASPTLQGLGVRQMSIVGIYVSDFFARAMPTIDQCVIEQCGVGVHAATDLGGFAMTQTVVRNNTSHGIEVSNASSFFLSSSSSVRDSRVESNAGTGILLHASNHGAFTVVLERTLVVDNGEGVRAQDDYPPGSACTTQVIRCTIADNTGIGASNDDHNGNIAQLRETILFGNGDDVVSGTFGPMTAAFCDIGDGDFGGTNSNFAADPQFVDPASGNYALQHDSPCIDAGDPNAVLDPDCSIADIGALAFFQSAPATYCTAKVNSCGSLPSLSWTGAPSASSTSGFVVRASHARAQKPGLLIYSVTGPAAIPFQGGTLCVAVPVKRSVQVMDAVGTPGQCDGVLELDMNAFASGSLGGNPVPELGVSGTHVWCQFWGRDTPAAGVLLSDALQYFICQ